MTVIELQAYLIELEKQLDSYTEQVIMTNGAIQLLRVLIEKAQEKEREGSDHGNR